MNIHPECRNASWATMVVASSELCPFSTISGVRMPRHTPAMGAISPEVMFSMFSAILQLMTTLFQELVFSQLLSQPSESVPVEVSQNLGPLSGLRLGQ